MGFWNLIFPGAKFQTRTASALHATLQLSRILASLRINSSDLCLIISSNDLNSRAPLIYKHVRVREQKKNTITLKWFRLTTRDHHNFHKSTLLSCAPDWPIFLFVTWISDHFHLVSLFCIKIMLCGRLMHGKSLVASIWHTFNEGFDIVPVTVE